MRSGVLPHSQLLRQNVALVLHDVRDLGRHRPAKGEMDPLPPQRGHGVRPGLDRVLDRVVLVRRDPDGLPGEGDGVVTGRRVRCSNGTELKKTRSVFGAGARTLQVRLAMLHQERSGTAGTCDVQ